LTSSWMKSSALKATITDAEDSQNGVRPIEVMGRTRDSPNSYR
jgi:hypothetical protein